jgi:hypothetical protein
MRRRLLVTAPRGGRAAASAANAASAGSGAAPLAFSARHSGASGFPPRRCLATSTSTASSRPLKHHPAGWEVVVGLELHAQILSQSKLFSGTHTCLCSFVDGCCWPRQPPAWSGEWQLRPPYSPVSHRTAIHHGPWWYTSAVQALERSSEERATRRWRSLMPPTRAPFRFATASHHRLPSHHQPLRSTTRARGRAGPFTEVSRNEQRVVVRVVWRMSAGAQRGMRAAGGEGGTRAGRAGQPPLAI